MARELSSNWKQLQAHIQAESSSQPDVKTPSTLKRKASGKGLASVPKKQKKPVVSRTAAASASTTHDLDALQLTHSIKDIRDTSKFPGFRQYGNGKKPALRKLAGEILKVEIQQGAHSSVEDAKVTMALFRRHKPAFDVDNTNRFPTFAPGARSAAKKPKKKKK
ncbi:hypothetical protein BN1723_011873 [Verticillium longisporum]|uniref:Exonuclease domain-containing protein n=1 Tax=Verticillium longisporum TaxID=100787 RepID=A0A0G4LBJ4_VERLO|nr:hypothetical protein BN1723_011873 [Verticillium longisporum]